MAATAHQIMHYCYSVMHLNGLRDSLAILNGVDEDNMSVSTFELSFIYGLMTNGKHATLPVFFCGKEMQEARWEYVSFKAWVDTNSDTGFRRWKANICSMLYEVCDLTDLNSTNIVNRSVEQILNSHESRSLSKAVAKGNSPRRSIVDSFKHNNLTY